MSALEDVVRIYRGSDGELTRALYARLSEFGPIGTIAVNLFRAQKNSERAKVYRGRGYRGMAYDRKDWSLGELVGALEQHPTCGLVWGWGVDDKQPYHRHVLYIDLPTGQVSFHTGTRGAGGDYAGEWDGRPGQSPDRIMRWCARLLEGR